MKVTNKLNLPAAFVNAVSVERHNKAGCYSATTLNKGTKEIILQERHWDEFTVDAADSVWAVWGTAVHALMESQPDNNFHEEKFKVPVCNSFVTGQVDSYDMEHATIFDWKTASVWKVQFADFGDWYKQGMTYAWLLKQSGLDVRHCVFVALLKDHSKSKAAKDASYPQSPVFKYEFDVTDEELQQTEARIIAKVAEIENAYKLGDDDIEPCSAEERWADNEKWAVMKNGRKTAIKLFDNSADADAMAGEMGNSYYVEHRPAISRKCGEYCACKEFCNFYKSMKKDGGEE
uniref:Uncharacterized protein n=1 Tax=Siphoviridae sp. ctzm5103 TaxID=2825750 RepID=A0A8S5TT99_9CAUD|nr:MAG TPA: protein of unknown function DUF3799 [Siphoviridae sp. ctzm5103]